jgi:hypothetical protein
MIMALYLNEWVTVQLMPLPPGWRHVRIEDAGGDGEPFEDVCPALALQEERAKAVYTDGRRTGSVEYDPPFETRILPLDLIERGLLYIDDQREGEETAGDNYVGLYGPGEKPTATAIAETRRKMRKAEA